MRSRCAVLIAMLAGCAHVPAQAPAAPRAATAIPAGSRIRVWSGTAEASHWQIGQLVSLSGDSLVFDRTDLVVDSRVAMPLDSVTRLELFQGGRAHAAGIGCLGAGLALGLLGAGVKDPDSPGIGTQLAILGFGFGCAVGALVGTVVGSTGEWQAVPIVRRSASAMPGSPSIDVSRLPQSILPQ